MHPPFPWVKADQEELNVGGKTYFRNRIHVWRQKSSIENIQEWVLSFSSLGSYHVSRRDGIHVILS